MRGEKSARLREDDEYEIATATSKLGAPLILTEGSIIKNDKRTTITIKYVILIKRMLSNAHSIAHF